MYHGDVTPANILMTDRYSIKLADFGLSGFENEDKSFKGTIGYLPPEIYERKRFSGRRRDLYAASLTLFKLVTGRLPFKIADTSDPIFFLLYQDKWDRFWQALSVPLSDSLRQFFERTL